MNLGTFLLLISTLLAGVSLTYGFETWELDLFDIVEEVNANFYEVFELKPDCTAKELKKTFRKLSLQWHPDRNQDPGAEKMFRNVVMINDVLKDPKLRKRYDEVLETGLPNWRSASFYFRRARKLSSLELFVTLSLIISIGHYFVMWAQHFERRLTLEDQMSDVKKKLEKKQKKKNYRGSELDEIDNELQAYYDKMETPKLTDTLPYRFTCWSIEKIFSLPMLMKEKIFSSEKNVDIEEEVVEDTVVGQSGKRRNRNKENTEHLKLNPENISKSNIKITATESKTDSKPEDSVKQVNKNEWTDNEKNNLIKAINKCPAGTPNRWNKIGEMLNRSPADCINMDKQMKTNFSANNHLNASTGWTDTKTVLNRKEEPVPSVKLDENSNIDETKKDAWSQIQQIKFEEALKSVSKDVTNRWEKIAELVPEKTKEDCINRFKSLCTNLKKKQQDQLS